MTGRAGTHIRAHKLFHERVRDEIQSEKIINRLSNHVFGKAKMTNSQVRAGLGLLAKTLPDLQSIDLSGNLGVRTTIVRTPLTEAEMVAKHKVEMPAETVH